MGLGFNFRLNKNLSLNLEGIIHGFNSDELDTKVGGSKYDMYSYTSLGLTYKFIPKNEHPIIIKQPIKKFDLEKAFPPKTETKTEMIETIEIPEKIASSDEIAKKNKDIIKEKIKPKSETKKPIEQKNIITEQIAHAPQFEYRVQILAKLNKAPSLMYLQNKYGLRATIREDFHNGYYIYTVGSFKNYESTKRFRDKLRSENKIYDAYIVVFENGKRLNKLSELKK